MKQKMRRNCARFFLILVLFTIPTPSRTNPAMVAAGMEMTEAAWHSLMTALEYAAITAGTAAAYYLAQSSADVPMRTPNQMAHSPIEPHIKEPNVTPSSDTYGMFYAAMLNAHASHNQYLSMQSTLRSTANPSVKIPEAQPLTFTQRVLSKPVPLPDTTAEFRSRFHFNISVDNARAKKLERLLAAQEKLRQQQSNLEHAQLAFSGSEELKNAYHYYLWDFLGQVMSILHEDNQARRLEYIYALVENFIPTSTDEYGNTVPCHKEFFADIPVNIRGEHVIAEVHIYDSFTRQQMLDVIDAVLTVCIDKDGNLSSNGAPIITANNEAGRMLRGALKNFVREVAGDGDFNKLPTAHNFKTLRSKRRMGRYLSRIVDLDVSDSMFTKTTGLIDHTRIKKLGTSANNTFFIGIQAVNHGDLDTALKLVRTSEDLTPRQRSDIETALKKQAQSIVDAHLLKGHPEYCHDPLYRLTSLSDQLRMVKTPDLLNDFEALLRYRSELVHNLMSSFGIQNNQELNTIRFFYSIIDQPRANNDHVIDAYYNPESYPRDEVSAQHLRNKLFLPNGLLTSLRHTPFAEAFRLNNNRTLTEQAELSEIANRLLVYMLEDKQLEAVRIAGLKHIVAANDAKSTAEYDAHIAASSLCIEMLRGDEPAFELTLDSVKQLTHDHADDASADMRAIVRNAHHDACIADTDTTSDVTCGSGPQYKGPDAEPAGDSGLSTPETPQCGTGDFEEKKSTPDCGTGDAIKSGILPDDPRSTCNYGIQQLPSLKGDDAQDTDAEDGAEEDKADGADSKPITVDEGDDDDPHDENENEYDSWNDAEWQDVSPSEAALTGAERWFDIKTEQTLEHIKQGQFAPLRGDVCEDPNLEAHSEWLKQRTEATRKRAEEFNASEEAQKEGVYIDVDELVHHIESIHHRGKYITGYHLHSDDNCCQVSFKPDEGVIGPHGEQIGQVTWKDPSTGKIRRKRDKSSMFPEEWTNADVIDEIQKALRNGRYEKGDNVNKNGFRQDRVSMRCGFNIPLHVDTKTGEIKGYYPRKFDIKQDNCDGSCGKRIKK